MTNLKPWEKWLLVGSAAVLMMAAMIYVKFSNVIPTRLHLVHSASYDEGRTWARNWYSDPDRFAYAQNSMSHGGTAAFGCSVAVNLMARPANRDDWIDGCVAGTHDMGLRP